MKKCLLGLFVFASLNSTAYAGDLMQVYEQALVGDPIYQQAVSQRLANREAVPINLAAILPQASVVASPTLNRIHSSGTSSSPAISNTTRGYSVTLNLTQTVFNFAQFKALSGAQAAAKQADATLVAATQSLMLRVAQAYFNVLKDIDNLRANLANKEAYAKQLDQINQQYKVGLKTTTDLYTARASYDLASAQYIAAETRLEDDKENLRAITGYTYPSFAKLSENFPLISPQPDDMEAWVRTSLVQNWSIRAAQFTNQQALENVKQQNAGHLPTLNVQGSYNMSYNNALIQTGTASGGFTSTAFPTKTHFTDSTVSLNLNVPIFQGGLVLAEAQQAKYNYQVTTQQLEQARRSTMNATRQSFMGITSGIKQIQADKQAIISTRSSLEGLEEGYRVGTQTLVDVLNQQQKVFQAQTQYTNDRYDYVNNLLLLKQAAGTLSQNDLAAINAWLIESVYGDDQGTPRAHKKKVHSTHTSS